MTAAAADPGPDPVVEFRRHLPTHAERGLHVTQTVVALIHAAVSNHGWTPKLLAQECGRDLDTVANAGAVVTHRLRKAATHPPANQPTRRTPARPLCARCRDTAGWIEDPETRKPIAKCDCRKATP